LSAHKVDASGIKKYELIDKYDALHDENIKVWQNIVTNPLVVKDVTKKQLPDLWENHIKFFQCYIYDNDIKVGMPYNREKGVLFLNIDAEAEKRVKELVKLVNPLESDKILCEELARLLEYPAPNFKRVSLDAEILNEGNKIPVPENANLPIIAVCMVTDTGEKYAFVLIQEGKEFTTYDDVTEVNFFSDEKELLQAVFNLAKKFPFIITFNGDSFDFPYIANRALRLGIPIVEIPISLRERMSFWKDSIHIDLYKFFSIRAMMIYAFAQKYKSVDLDTVSKALLKEGKYVGENKWVGDMPYGELIKYCMKDAELTMRLTTFNSNIVMNLILVLSRLSYMPIENVSRKSISNWIRSMIYYEHRKRNVLIPRSEDIVEAKGQTVTSALVKGKKYKGAIVVTPKAGFHFNTKVGDFASLYPSIIKNWNLGYASVNCGHGQLWQKLSNDTKRLIYEKLYYICIEKEEVVKCQQINLELENLMRNIEKELPNIREITIEKIKPNSTNKTENDINSQCKTQNAENCIEPKPKLENKNGRNGTQKDLDYTTENGTENVISKSNSSSLPLKETNANFVGAQISDALKSIILMDEGREKQDNFVSFLNDMIGKNFNSFVQIVIELNIMSSCGTNTVASMQHWICTKNRAIEAQLIGTLKDLRVKWYKQQAKDKKNPRKPWYSVAEQSIKVICNAAYGVFGDDDFVLYCPPFAEYVTGIGRFIITQTIEKAQSLGLDIIYGDTDSIFIQNPDKEKLDELMSWAKLTFDIDFELDKNYRYVCLSDRKKNYLGVLESGDVDVKGLTGKKKHTPKIFKDAFEETKKLLSEIQKEEDVLPKKLAILKLVKTLYKKLRERKWDDINDLAFHVSLSKEMDEYEKTEPQHLKVAKYLKSKGYDVGQGSVIDYIKTNGKKVKPASMTNTEEVDVSKYIEFLRNTFIQILEPLDIDWDGDILGICQMDRFCKPE
jgi:DNA polymerase elongation subunit (family B)